MVRDRPQPSPAGWGALGGHQERPGLWGQVLCLPGAATLLSVPVCGTLSIPQLGSLESPLHSPPLFSEVCIWIRFQGVQLPCIAKGGHGVGGCLVGILTRNLLDPRWRGLKALFPPSSSLSPLQGGEGGTRTGI